MKIALFHNVPPGGAKRAAYEEVKYLSKNHDVYLYQYKNTDESFLNIQPFVKEVNKYDFELKSNLPSIFNRLQRDYQNFYLLNKLHKNIAKEINDNNYDVILIHPDSFTQAPFLLKHTKTPSLYFCEEYLRLVYEEQFRFKEKVNIFKRLYENYTRQIRKYIDRKHAKSVNLVVANSRFTKNNIDKAYDINARYCRLGVDPSVFRRPKNNKKGNYVLFIGERDDRLGYGLVKEAVLKLKRNNNIKLINLGFSKGSKKVSSDKEMVKEYSNAIATICTHQNEPFGIPPLESMACETPVLAVNEGGYKETVIDGKTGYLLPRDPKVFAEKITYLIDNPKVAEKLGKQGREHVKKNFNWEKHARSIEKYLFEVSKLKN